MSTTWRDWIHGATVRPMGLGLILIMLIQVELPPAHSAVHSSAAGGPGVTHQGRTAIQATLPPQAQSYLKSSNTAIRDYFGSSAAIEGNTVVIGAYAEDSIATGVNGNQADNSAPSAGAAYVFGRSGTTWSQQAYLKASNTQANDNFGQSVAIDSDTIVVGAPYEDSAATGVDGNQADNSAESAGAVYVFGRSGTTWSQQAYLKASNTQTNDGFGFRVAISGDTIVVGAYGEDSAATGVNGNQANNSASFAGAVYVFVRTGPVGSPVWSQQAYLKASNTQANDEFGYRVAIAANLIAVGAEGEDSAATGVNGNQADNSAAFAGAVYIFARTGPVGSPVWAQQAYLKASNTQANDRFSRELALAGTTLVVGAEDEDSAASGVNGNQADNSATSAGAAYVFTYSGPGSRIWSQQAYLKSSNTQASAEFGSSVAIAGDTIVVGAVGERSASTGVNGNQQDNSAPYAGAAYVFGRSGPSWAATWSQEAYFKAFNTEANDRFGQAVAIAGETILVSALYESSAATGINGNQQDNSATQAGAAYVFGQAPHPTYLPLVMK